MDYNEKIRQIEQRLDGPRYKDLPIDSVKGSLIKFLIRQYKRKGQAYSPEQLAEMIDILDEDINRYFGAMATYPEVELAIDWGLHGEYGEFTGMNADRLFRFVRNYMDSDERREAVKHTEAVKYARQKLRPDAMETGRLNWDALYGRTVAFWEEFKTTGTVSGLYPDHAHLFGVHRHVGAECLAWMKSTQILARDEALFDLESRNEKRARQMLSQERIKTGWENPEEAVKSLAGLLTLFDVFDKGRKAGFDFDARFAELGAVPADERSYYA